MSETRRCRRQLVDPGWMQVLSEVADRAQELSGNQRQIIVQEPVDRSVFETDFGLAIFLDYHFKLGFPQNLVLVQEVEHGIEVRNEGGRAIFNTHVVRRCVTR